MPISKITIGHVRIQVASKDRQDMTAIRMWHATTWNDVLWISFTKKEPRKHACFLNARLDGIGIDGDFGDDAEWIHMLVHRFYDRPVGWLYQDHLQRDESTQVYFGKNSIHLSLGGQNKKTTPVYPSHISILSQFIVKLKHPCLGKQHNIQILRECRRVSINKEDYLDAQSPQRQPPRDGPLLGGLIEEIEIRPRSNIIENQLCDVILQNPNLKFIYAILPSEVQQSERVKKILQDRPNLQILPKIPLPHVELPPPRDYD